MRALFSISPARVLLAGLGAAGLATPESAPHFLRAPRRRPVGAGPGEVHA
jgi:hypothetical protein